MLNLGYLRKTNEYSWDRPNIDAIGIEPHEQHRCWAAATQVMNHFYGGNLTQDEIVYKIKNEDPLLSSFYISGAKFKLDSTNGEPSGTKKHVMIIYGYVGDSTNKPFFFTAYINQIKNILFFYIKRRSNK